MTNKFTVYSKPDCPFCDKVKDYLDNNEITYDVIDITVVPEGRAKLVDAGFTTVPQVFTEGDEYFGDCGTTISKLS